MSELFFNGKKYISARRAAEIAKYTNDYVGQLCREGKVDSRMIGRSWYVSEESIIAHKNQFERPQSVHIAGVTRPYPVSVTPKSVTPPRSNVEIRVALPKDPLPLETLKYFADDRPLLPSLSKVKPAAPLSAAVAPLAQRAVLKTAAMAPDVFASGFRTVSKISPALVHKATALALSLSMVFGIYITKENPDARIDVKEVAVITLDFANRVKNDIASITAEDVIAFADGAWSALEHAAALATDPDWIGQAASSAKGAANSFLDRVAGGFYSGVNSFASKAVQSVAGIFRPGADIASPLGGAGTALPDAEVAKSAKEDGATSAGDENKSSGSVGNGPAASALGTRIITERIVMSGISRGEVEEKLLELNRKLSTEIYALSTVASSRSASNRESTREVVDAVNTGNLRSPDISKPTITKGTITGATISDATITGSTITGSTFTGSLGSFSGSLSTGGDLTVDGEIAVSGTGTSTFAGGLAVKTNKLVVDSTSGNVGIGTTSPGASLSVEGSLIVTGSISSISAVTATSTITATNFVASSASATSTIAGGLAIETTGFVYDYSTNKVGIGTASPSYTLDVTGDSRFTSTSTAPYFALSALGAVGAPALTFVADPDTGLWSSGSDTLNFSTGGSERIRINSQGNVGIGTTSPSSLLSLGGSFYVSGVSFLGGAVTSTSTVTGLTFTATGSTASTLPYASTTAVTISDTASTTNLTVSSLTANRIPFVTTAGSITDDGDLTFTNGNLLTATYASSTVLSVSNSAYFATSAGNVGIGTTSPASKLAVSGGLSVGADYNIGAPTNGAIIQGNVGIGTTTPSAKFAFTGDGTGATRAFVIADSANSEKVTILNNGNVGIGTTTPVQLLSVGGNTYITGGLGVGIATTTSGVLQVSGNAYIGGNLTVIGNSATLGESSSDTLVINSAVKSSIIPNQNATHDLGSAAFYWNNGYFATITANNLSAGSTNIGGTQSATITINTDNGTSDTEDSSLIFYRGVTVPNAVIAWDSTLDKFDVNQPIFFQNDSSTTTVTSLDVWGKSGQTANLFRLASSTGEAYVSVTATGNVGIGSTTPAKLFSVGGDVLVSGNLSVAGITATSTSITFSGLGKHMILTTDASGNVLASSTPTAAYYIATSSTASIFPYASTTAITVSGTASTTNLTVSSLTSTRIPFLSTAGAFTDDGDLTFTNGNLLTATYASSTVLSVSNSAYFATSAGNVGIGTTTPSKLLSVQGDVLVSGNLSVAGITATSTSITFSGLGTNMLTSINASGNLVATSTPTLSHFFATSTTATSTIAGGLAIETTGFVYDYSTNKVGIGTASPSYTLDVTGDSRFTSTSTAPYFALSALGAVGAPALTFVADPDTGLWSSGSDTLNFSTGGSERIRINSQGNVGIGTTTPTNLLGVQGSGYFSGSLYIGGAITATSTLAISGAITSTATTANTIPYASSTAITVSGTGFFGTASTTNLTVSSLVSGRVPYITTAGAFTDDSDLTFDGSRLTATYLTSSYASTTNISSTGGAWFATSGGNVGIGSTSPWALLGINAPAGQASFAVGSSTGTHLVVNANGNIGINTSAPAYRFDIDAATSVNAAPIFRVQNTAYNTDMMTINAVGNFIYAPNNNFSGQASETVVNFGNNLSNTTGTFFLINPASQTGNVLAVQEANTTRFVVDGGGNVGIATTTPGSRFAVQGDALISGNLSVAGITATSTSITFSGLGTNMLTSINASGNLVATSTPTAARYLATSSTASIFPYASTTAISSTGGAWFATSGGNVGIGTTSPHQTLAVAGTVYVDTSLGIRTTNPSYHLDVRGNGQVTGSFYTDNVNINNSGAINYTGTVLTLGQSAGWTATAIYGGTTEVARATSGGNIGVGTSTPYSKLSVWASGTGTGQLFELVNNASTTVARFLDSGTGYLVGNIGIGTTTPSKLFSVQGDALLSGNLSVAGITATSTNITFSGLGTNMLTSINTSGNLVATSTPTLSHFFATSTTATSTIAGGLAIETTGFVYDYSTGNVGVGIANMHAKLEVNGTGLTDRGQIRTASNSSVNVSGVDFALNNGDLLGFVGWRGSSATNPSAPTGGGVFLWNHQSSIPIIIGAGNEESVRFDGSGRTGFASSTPYATLSLSGNATSRTVFAVDALSSQTSPIVDVKLASSTKFIIDSGGNVGIGSTTPAKLFSVGGDSYLSGSLYIGGAITATSTLAISGAITSTATTANVLPYASSTNLTVSNSAYFATSGGNVGVGTATPGKALHLANSGTTGIAVFEGTSAVTDNNWGHLIVARNSLTSGAEAKMSFNFGTTNSYDHPVASIGGLLTSSSERAGALTFYTRPDTATVSAERMRITSSGNVGIGTTSPGALFAIGNAVSSGGVYVNSNGNVGIGIPAPETPLHLSSTGTGTTFGTNVVLYQTSRASGRASTIQLSDASNAAMYLSYLNGASAPRLGIGGSSEVLSVTSAGNVGIGTTSPQQKLHVDGIIASSPGNGFYWYNGANFAGAIKTSDATNHNMQFYTQGDGSTPRMVILNGGNVGIGTTTPTSILNLANTGTAQFTITDTDASANQKHWYLQSSAGDFRLGTTSDALSVQTSQLTIDENGNVGIGQGASEPAAKLHIAHGGAVIINSNSTDFAALRFRHADNIATSSLQFSGDNNGIYAQVSGRQMLPSGAGTPTDGRLDFWTMDGSSLGMRMTILDTGNVGIGRTDPTTKLDVYAGTISSTGGAGLVLDATGSGTGTSYGRFTNTSGQIIWGVESSGGGSLFGSTLGYAAVVGTQQTQALQFATANATRMTIASGGNVGIGTTSPAAKLNIQTTSLDGLLLTSATTDTPNLMFRESDSGTTWNLDKNNGVLRFFTETAIGGVGGSVKMVIDANGNVGVGTASPSSYQHGGTNKVIELQNSGTGTNDQAHLFLTSGTTNAESSIGSISWALPNASASNKGLGIIAGVTGSGSTSANPSMYMNFYTRATTDSNWQERMRISESGNVGIGTTSPWAKLAVEGTVSFKSLTTATTGNYLCHNTTSNEITSGTTCSLSSERYKQNITDISYGLAAVRELRPVSFNYRPEYNISGNQVGFISEEMVTVIPEVVVYESDGRVGGIDYGKLTSVLAKAIQELDVRDADIGRALQSATSTLADVAGDLSAATSTLALVQGQIATAVMFDSNGNVGLGTTTPEYKMHVVGDVAATSFVNISTKTAKKDIEYLDESEKGSILAKIKDVGIATYNYTGEGAGAPKRLGLIAEEAPSEVLSANGRGVDVYKLSTFILAGVQEQQKRIEKLELRIAKVEEAVAELASSTAKFGASAAATSAVPNGAAATSTSALGTSSAPTSGAGVIAALVEYGVSLVDNVIKFAKLAVDELLAKTITVENASAASLTIGSANRPSGITLYDEATGAPYCLKILQGAMTSAPGVCPIVERNGSSVTVTSQSAPTAPASSETSSAATITPSSSETGTSSSSDSAPSASSEPSSDSASTSESSTSPESSPSSPSDQSRAPSSSSDSTSSSTSSPASSTSSESPSSSSDSSNNSSSSDQSPAISSESSAGTENDTAGASATSGTGSATSASGATTP